MDMEFCSICSSSLDSDDNDARRIRCSGQCCNLVFHQRCVHLTEAHVRSFLDEDVGLFWFCSTCRVDFAPGGASSSRKHKVSEDQQSDEEEGESSARQPKKKVKMESTPRLPPEIWTMIFEHLESRWLARMRLVCRGWNELVCSRTELMDRFLLKLGKVKFVDDLDELRHFLSLSRGFTNAQFNLSDAKDKPRIDWFNVLGQTLTTLTCRSMPFGYVCELLCALPKLKRLTLSHCFQYGKTMKLKYQLNNLEQLIIEGFNNKNYGESIFPNLQHICPYITVLEIDGIYFDKFTKQIGLFLYAIRQSLQKLSIGCSSELINEMIKMSKDLRLKQLSIDCIEHDLLRLIQRLPSLEHLRFRGRLKNVSIFEEIPRILANLTTLELNNVSLAATTPPNPLNLTRAEFIRICYNASPYCVSGLSFCLSSSLQRLEITGAYLPSDALANLGQIATRIKNVTFSSCRVQCASDIFSFVQQAKSLTVLELYWLAVKSVGDLPDPIDDHSNIHQLNYRDSSKELLASLVKLSPNLEILNISNLVSEEDVLAMGHQLKRLKSLALCGDEITLECLRQIPNGFEALQNLYIIRCKLSNEEIQEALKDLRKSVVVDLSVNYWWSHKVIPSRLMCP